MHCFLLLTYKNKLFLIVMQKKFYIHCESNPQLVFADIVDKLFVGMDCKNCCDMLSLHSLLNFQKLSSYHEQYPFYASPCALAI